MSYPRLTKCMPDETRPNPFHLLHKALRFGHCRMLSELGAQDFSDGGGSERLLASLLAQLDLCRAAAQSRHAAMDATPGACGPEVQAWTCTDHAGHMTALTELASLVRAVTVAATPRRRLAGRSLYRCYALYASADMARMDADETLLLGALHACLADDQLCALEGRIFAALAPAHVAPLMRLLLPGLPSAELNGLLDLLQGHLDPVFFASDVEPVMRPLLAGGRYAAA